MADADVPLVRYGDLAETVGRYVDEVKKLADTKRDAADAQAKMLAANAFRLADDPTKTSGVPAALKVVPHFNFAPLENAVDRLKKSAKDYDTALGAKGTGLAEQSKTRLFELARERKRRWRLRSDCRGGAGTSIFSTHRAATRATTRRRCRVSAKRSKRSAGTMPTAMRC